MRKSVALLGLTVKQVAGKGYQLSVRQGGAWELGKQATGSSYLQDPLTLASRGEDRGAECVLVSPLGRNCSCRQLRGATGKRSHQRSE